MQNYTSLAPSSGPVAGRCCIPNLAITTAAEAELTAFYSAVQTCHGAARADEAAELWLKIFVSAAIDPCNLKRALRKVTIAAASQMAADIRRPA